MDVENLLFTIEMRDGHKITCNNEVAFFQASRIDMTDGMNMILRMVANGMTMVNIENVLCIRLADDVETRSYRLFHPKEGDEPCT